MFTIVAPAARCASSACTSAIGATTLTSKTVRSTSGSMARERRERAGAERAGVVHDQVARRRAPRPRRELAPVLGVGDVAGDADDVGARPEARRPRRRADRRGGRRSRAPSPRGERLGEREAEPLGRAGDDCDVPAVHVAASRVVPLGPGKNKLLLVLMPVAGSAARMPFADADGPRRRRDAGARARSTLVEV